MEKDLSKAKVLVCDDSMMVRNKMKKLLTAYGFTPVSYTHLTLPTILRV